MPLKAKDVTREAPLTASVEYIVPHKLISPHSQTCREQVYELVADSIIFTILVKLVSALYNEAPTDTSDLYKTKIMVNFLLKETNRDLDGVSIKNIIDNHYFTN